MDSPASGRGWRLADATSVPALWNVGHDGVPIDEDEAFERIAAKPRRGTTTRSSTSF